MSAASPAESLCARLTQHRQNGVGGYRLVGLEAVERLAEGAGMGSRGVQGIFVRQVHCGEVHRGVGTGRSTECVLEHAPDVEAMDARCVGVVDGDLWGVEEVCDGLNEGDDVRALRLGDVDVVLGLQKLLMCRQ